MSITKRLWAGVFLTMILALGGGVKAFATHVFCVNYISFETIGVEPTAWWVTDCNDGLGNWTVVSSIQIF